MSDFLSQIVEATRQRLGQRSLPELERLARRAGPVRGFAAALRRKPLALIAEVKRASPSKGWLRRNLDVASLAQSYERGGAAAISVLTEPQFFQGSLDDLASARQAVSLPILCKDFILDPRQVYEARATGADAVLLIAAILSSEELESLRGLAESLGMAALVEVHSLDEVEKTLGAGAGIVGINNRDLHDFSVSLETTLRLRPLIPGHVLVVSESGIKGAADIAGLRVVGVNAVLIGEALVTSRDPVAKIRGLLGDANNP